MVEEEIAEGGLMGQGESAQCNHMRWACMYVKRVVVQHKKIDCEKYPDTTRIQFAIESTFQSE